MREEKVNGKKVLLYDEVETLPIIRFQKFNKIIMVDAGIGSDMNDVNGHLSKMLLMNEKGDKVNLRQEIMNMSQNLAFVLENVNLKSNAFSVMVHSYDGKVRNDISDFGLQKTSEKINAPYGFIRNIVEELKKKLTMKFQNTSKTSETIAA